MSKDAKLQYRLSMQLWLYYPIGLGLGGVNFAFLLCIDLRLDCIYCSKDIEAIDYTLQRMTVQFLYFTTVIYYYMLYVIYISVIYYFTTSR